MAPFLDTFDLTAIINIPDRRDRYRECLRELNLIGLQPTPGKVEFFPGQRVTTLDGFPTLGARGGFLAHLALIREAQRRGVKSLCVFEDDFEIARKDVAPLLKAVETAQSLPWDFLYLGHRLSLLHSPSRFTDTKDPVITAHAFAIRSSVFEPLSEYLEGCIVRPPGDPIGGPQFIDGGITMFRQRNPSLITLVANPSRVTQRSSRSDISPSGFEHIPVVRQTASLTRQAITFWKQSRKASQL
jgi:glycosyl transferase family 25